MTKSKRNEGKSDNQEIDSFCDNRKKRKIFATNKVTKRFTHGRDWMCEIVMRVCVRACKSGIPFATRCLHLKSLWRAAHYFIVVTSTNQETDTFNVTAVRIGGTVIKLFENNILKLWPTQSVMSLMNLLNRTHTGEQWKITRSVKCDRSVNIYTVRIKNGKQIPIHVIQNGTPTRNDNIFSAWAFAHSLLFNFFLRFFLDFIATEAHFLAFRTWVQGAELWI